MVFDDGGHARIVRDSSNFQLSISVVKVQIVKRRRYIFERGRSNLTVFRTYVILRVMAACYFCVARTAQATYVVWVVVCRIVKLGIDVLVVINSRSTYYAAELGVLADCAFDRVWNVSWKAVAIWH